MDYFNSKVITKMEVVNELLLINSYNIAYAYHRNMIDTFS